LTKKSDIADPQHTICIIGAGRVGGAFALALAKRGWEVQLVSRNPRQASLRLLHHHNLTLSVQPLISKYFLLALADQRITSAASGLARWLKGQPESVVAPIFLHSSGARPVADLLPLRKFGPIGALHPLLAIPDARGGAAALPGATLTFQGDLRAFPAAVLIGKFLGCRLITLPSRANRLRYHAAAVIASNLPYALWLQAEQLSAPFFGSPEKARAALLPLIHAALRNYEQAGGAGLTGPARRGDRALIRAECRALRGVTRETYELLNRYLLGTSRKA